MGATHRGRSGGVRMTVATRQKIDRDAVRRCYAEGMSDHETSRHLGCSHRIIGLIRKEMGLPAHPQRRRVVGRCAGCGEDARRTAAAGPVCDRCHAWAVVIEKRLVVMLDDEHDRNRRNGDDEPLAVTRGRGVVAASAERQP